MVLALVMTLGLATVSANAAFEGESFNFNEAVDVMHAVGVFKGDENGKFNPGNSLDRASAAKLIAYLDLGEKTAEALPQAQMFSDVPASHWASKYIAYCAQSGYVSGYDGKFFPAGELNGYAFGKMILCTLGYDANIEGLSGTTTWTISVAKLMESNDITDGIDTNASLTLTREQAAQYCLNALQATMVEYSDKGTTIDIGGTKVVTSAKKAAEVTSSNAYAKAFTNEGAGTSWTLQLGEKLYKGDLTRTAGSDDMNRTANVWSYKTEIVTKEASSADTKIVVAKQGKTYAYIVEDYNAKYTHASVNDVHINGGTAVANTTVAKVGDIVELFMSDTTANQVDKIVVTQYSAAKVTGAVATSTDSGKTYVRIPGALNTKTETKYVTGYADLAKNDIVYYYTGKDGTTTTYHFFKAESFDGSITTKSSGTPTKYTIDGTQYTVNGNVGAANIVDGGSTIEVYNTKHTYYTDDNKNIIWAVAIEENESDYVVIDELALNSTSGVGKTNTVEARLIKMDGTTEVVTVKSITVAAGTKYSGSTNNSTAGTNLVYNTSTSTAAKINDAVDTELTQTAFFTYTTSDGKYELKEVADNTTNKLLTDTPSTNVRNQAITNKASAINAGTSAVAVNDNTIFVIAKVGSDNDDHEYAVYTGKNNVPSITSTDANKAAAITKDGVATYVFVGAYTGNAVVAGDTIYLINGVANDLTAEKNESGDTKYIQTFDAIIDGEVTTVRATSDSEGAVISGASYGLFSPSYETDGKTLSAITTNVLGVDKAASYTYSSGTLVVGTATYNCSADAVAYYVDQNDDDKTSKGVVGDYTSDDNDSVYVVKTTDSTPTVDYIVIYGVDDDEVGLSALTLTIPDPSVSLTMDDFGSTGTLTDGTSGIYTYTLASDAAGKKATVTATAVDAGKATVQYCSTVDGTYGDTKTVTTGATGASASIFVKVTASDGTTSAIYEVKLNTAAS